LRNHDAFVQGGHVFFRPRQRRSGLAEGFMTSDATHPLSRTLSGFTPPPEILTMRIAIISDVHGNHEALQVVLRDIERSKADSIISLGDNVGYGPEPEDVLKTLNAWGVPSVMGNHELGLVDPSSHPWFNKPALQSLLITQKLLSDQSLDSIAGLPPKLQNADGLFVHGSPPDSITRYIFEISSHEMAGLINDMDHETCFVGHTHVLTLYTLDGTGIQELPLREGVIALPPGQRSIVNAGSVGQPRDGDNRAKYLIWEPEERCIEVRCIPYDIAKTAARIIERGFPRFNADRLW
jgi:diadenosine tetraphosphatase ApaH/serine/threonine PP2A family protein phosphatase